MFKAELEFRVGNRRVSQQEFFKNLERQVVEQARKSITQKVRSVTDPTTGRPPMIRSVPGEPLDMKIVGSKEAIAHVRAKLR